MILVYFGICELRSWKFFNRLCHHHPTMSTKALRTAAKFLPPKRLDMAGHHGFSCSEPCPSPNTVHAAGLFRSGSLVLENCFSGTLDINFCDYLAVFCVPWSDLLLNAYLHIMLLLQRGYVNQTSCSQLSLENPSLGTDGSRQTPFFRRFGAHADENRFNHIREKECDE